MRLILIRHAKSSWDDPFADDHARVLNKRGRKSADAVGQWLREKGYLPDQLLSSDSARTKETTERLMAGWPTPPEPRFLPALYHADPGTLLETLQGATGDSVALIAHNPGIGSFASLMVATPPDHARYTDYPTCATAVIDFDADAWTEVRPGTGRVTDFIVPRELTG